MDWISLAERLPEPGTRCDFLMPRNGKDDDAWILASADHEAFEDYGGVTHWRPAAPLPDGSVDVQGDAARDKRWKDRHWLVSEFLDRNRQLTPHDLADIVNLGLATLEAARKLDRLADIPLREVEMLDEPTPA